MAVITEGRAAQRTAAKASFLYRPEVRQVIYQVVLVVLVVALFYMLISNTAANLRRQNIASGFGFIDRTSGFDISQHLIAYDNSMSYGRAFLVGLINTLLVAGLGIFFATILGFLIGIARLSSNWLIAKLAAVYVEIVRNIPLLLQLFFWYFAVLKSLPAPRQSMSLPGGVFLNVRGLQLPAPIPLPGFGAVWIALLVGVVLSAAVYFWARQRQMQTGAQFPVLWTSLALIVLMPLGVYLAAGAPLAFDYPELKGFNFQGGITVLPEFMALLLGLTFYTASFIAEIVRSGIAGVAKGQKEAANALGLSNGQTLAAIKPLPYNFRTGLNFIYFKFTPSGSSSIGNDCCLVILDQRCGVVGIVDPFDPQQPNRAVPPLPEDDEPRLAAPPPLPFAMSRPSATDTLSFGPEELYPVEVRSRAFFARLGGVGGVGGVGIEGGTGTTYTTQTVWHYIA